MTKQEEFNKANSSVKSPYQINSEGEEFYEVEDIIGHQLKKRELKLLVKWISYPKPTYESFTDFAEDAP